jgi:hypothetical protein
LGKRRGAGPRRGGGIVNSRIAKERAAEMTAPDE